MGIFSSIKNAIFGDKDDAKADKARQPAVRPATPAKPTPQSAARPQTPAPQPASLNQVDVEQRLDNMPGSDRLNWRNSIVDLMKLIGVDSSYENRKELARELGRTDYDGSADDNIWLHKRTMRELAANGGKVPQKLLD